MPGLNAGVGETGTTRPGLLEIIRPLTMLDSNDPNQSFNVVPKGGATFPITPTLSLTMSGLPLGSVPV